MKLGKRLERGIYEHGNKKGWFIVRVPGVEPDSTVRVECAGPKLASARNFRRELQTAVFKARQGDHTGLERLLAHSHSSLANKSEEVQAILFRDISVDYLGHLERRRDRGEITEEHCRNFEYRKPIHEKHFQGCEAASITTAEITAYLDNLKVKGNRTPKPATYNAYRLDLLSMWALAVDSGKLQVNPVHKVPFLSLNNERRRFASVEEDAKIRAVIRKQCPHREDELDLFVFTGMREDEGWRLRRENVYLDVRLALLRDTKNGTDEFIPLCDEALAAIERLNKRADGSGFVIPNPPDRFGKRQSERSKRYSAKWFRRACRKAGVQDFRFHDLRHTFASRVRLRGEEITTIKDLLRHKDIKSTLRYAHVGNEHLAAAVKKLSTFASGGK